MSNRLKKTVKNLTAVLIIIACGLVFVGCSLSGLISDLVNSEPVATVHREANYNADEDNERLTETLYEGLYSCRGQIDLSEFGLTAENGGEDAVHKQLQYLLNNRAELFYVMSYYNFTSDSSGFIVSLSPSYSLTGTELEAARVEFDALVKAIVATADTDLTPLETLVYYHDYLVLNFDYDDTLKSNTAYSMLKSGTGVCQSYTLLYAELLRIAGIETSSVVNLGMKHIWNGVRLDGQWYHIDVTHDDPVGTLPGNISHEYFLCSDGTLADHGTPDGWERNFVGDSAKYENIAKPMTSQVVRLDSRYYAICGESIVELDERLEAVDTVYSFDTEWRPFDEPDTYYPDTVFSGLVCLDGRLLFNTPEEILSFDPESKTAETVYTYKGEDGHIFGLYSANNTVRAVIAVSSVSEDFVKTVTVIPS